MSEVLDNLSASSCVRVTTFRRDGRAVPTPVWAARDGDSLVIWTVADSGKIKRLRHTRRVLICPCTYSGKPTGEDVTAEAVILDTAGTDHVRQVIAHKYGLMGRLTIWLSLLRRGRNGTVGVRVTLT